jgi:hypothetical protein
MRDTPVRQRRVIRRLENIVDVGQGNVSPKTNGAMCCAERISKLVCVCWLCTYKSLHALQVCVCIHAHTDTNHKFDASLGVKLKGCSCPKSHAHTCICSYTHGTINHPSQTSQKYVVQTYMPITTFIHKPIHTITKLIRTSIYTFIHIQITTFIHTKMPYTPIKYLLCDLYIASASITHRHTYSAVYDTPSSPLVFTCKRMNSIFAPL